MKTGNWLPISLPRLHKKNVRKPRNTRKGKDNQFLISTINEQEHDDKVSGGQEHEQSDSDMVFEHPIVQEGVGGVEHIADVFGWDGFVQFVADFSEQLGLEHENKTNYGAHCRAENKEPLEGGKKYPVKRWCGWACRVDDELNKLLRMKIQKHELAGEQGSNEKQDSDQPTVLEDNFRGIHGQIHLPLDLFGTEVGIEPVVPAYDRGRLEQDQPADDKSQN